MSGSTRGEFKDSAALSLGVELELQLVSQRDYDLTRGATDLLGSMDYDGRFGENKLENTECALIDDPSHAEEVLRGLKELGFTIALDDFGTGYSSLGYLHRFAIDSIKIDRTFVSRLHAGEKTLEIVSAIIGLAKIFHLGTIAEGIEHKDDIATLCDLGCTMGQGYYFSKPLPVADALVYGSARSR